MEPGEVTRSALDEAAAIEREMTDDERLAMVISAIAHPAAIPAPAPPVDLVPHPPARATGMSWL